MIKRGLLAGMLLSAKIACGQQMAVTFDDLPVHGAMPSGMTRLEIAQSILATLKRERMPPVYGFINGQRVDEDPTLLAVLKAWRAAAQPLANHTWAHLDLNKQTAEQFETEVLKNEPLLASWNAPYARCLTKHDEVSIRKLHDGYLAVADQYYGVFRQLSQLVYGRDVKYVLLMHVGAFDAQMLPELLAMYRAKGMSFISLADAMSDPAYQDDPDIGESSGGAFLELMMEQRRLSFPANTKPYKELEAMCR